MNSFCFRAGDWGRKPGPEPKEAIEFRVVDCIWRPLFFFSIPSIAF